MKAASADEPAGFGPSPLTHTLNSDRGDSIALDESQLLREFGPALRSWASRYSGGDAELRNDLFQEGALGLCQAARRLDENLGFQDWQARPSLKLAPSWGDNRTVETLMADAIAYIQWDSYRRGSGGAGFCAAEPVALAPAGPSAQGRPGRKPMAGVAVP